jgi:hypothetical protein
MNVAQVVLPEAPVFCPHLLTMAISFPFPVAADETFEI